MRNRNTIAVIVCLLISGVNADISLSFAERDTDGHSLHGKIVKDALSGTLNQANLAVVIKGVAEQAKSTTMPADLLFTGQSFKSSVGFIDREQKKILNYAGEADSSESSRYHCLKHFGEMLFVAQDFYSRSNFVEVEGEKLTTKFGKSGFDPYNIELVDWNKLNNAAKQNEPLLFGPASQKKETAEQGSTVLASTTFYKAARELAVRETTRQWEILETLIKHRYRERAANILTALKEASCPATEPAAEDEI